MSRYAHNYAQLSTTSTKYCFTENNIGGLDI